jgi:hypothetical protein
VSRAWAKGSTRRWRRLRAVILANNAATNQGRCNLSLPDVCTGQADTVHHTLGKDVTGDDPRYLMATCRACNLSIGDPRKTKTTAPPFRRVSSW